MDTPTQRTIKINDKPVGLLGLDVALNELQGREIAEEQAVDFLLKAVARQNYIPPKALLQYREGLRLEYRRHLSEEAETGQRLTIRVLGSACVTCNKIMTMAIDILQDKGIAADVEGIHDLDEIWRHGVTQTPALIINGEVKCAGYQPPYHQLEQWLLEAADKEKQVAT